MPGLIKKEIGRSTRRKRKQWSKEHEQLHLYHSTRWRKFRATILQKEPLCRECKQHDILTPATVLDHIHPVVKGGEFFEESNVQPLCAICHNNKSANER